MLAKDSLPRVPATIGGAQIPDWVQMLPFHQVCRCDQLCYAFSVGRRWPPAWQESADVVGELYFRVCHALDMLDIEQQTEPIPEELDTLLDHYLVAAWNRNGIAGANENFGPVC